MVQRIPRVGWAAASGVLWLISQEPTGIGSVGWVALTPLFLTLDQARRARHALLFGFITGLTFFGLQFAWVFAAGWMAWTGLVLIMAAYPALAAVAAYYVRRLPGAPALIAGAWTGAEILRDRWPWGGFGWGTLGVSQGTVPGVRSLAGAIGTLGLTFVCAFLAAWLARLLGGRGATWKTVLIVSLAIGLFAAGDLARGSRQPRGKDVTVAVVQPRVPRPERPDQDELILRSLEDQTRRITQVNKPDVIIWPENAVGVFAPQDAQDRVAAVAREVGVPILSGRSVGDLPGRRYWNYVDQVDASGRRVATYQKRHPMPFGEYVPIPRLLPYVRSLQQIAYDMIPGHQPVVFRVAGAHIGVPICFESIFARDVRAFARAGADLIVVATNDSSFEMRPVSEQHLAHTRMRALELRQWVVQAGLSGMSAVIGPDGRIGTRTRLFEETTLQVSVVTRPARTLYALVGDTFSYAAASASGACLAFVILTRLRRHSSQLFGRARRRPMKRRA